MSGLLRQLIAKQKADRLKAQIRLENRRGYARAGRERARAQAQQDGLNDLPAAVAAAIEETPAPAPPEPAKPADASVEELVARLTAIRERLFWLQAVWATTLSDDVFHEAEKYRRIFHELSDQLRQRDPAAVENLVLGHESLLLSEPAPPRPTLPLAVQQWFELTGELQNMRVTRVAPKPDGYVADGLQSFL